MFAVAHDVVIGFAETLTRVLPYLGIMAVGFAFLSWLSPCNEGRPWWEKRGLVTDLCYWLFFPLFTRYARIGFTVLFTVYLLGIDTEGGIIAFFKTGHGPLSQLPLWTQIGIYVVAGDFCLYWIHRAFHRGRLWKYHAVHHSSKDVDWTSAARFHPVNLILGTVAVDVLALMAGFNPDVFVLVTPFNVLTSGWVHANLDWTLGPLKYAFVGPVFHRWHHAAEGEGKNFASTFSLWDRMFGTFHMPEGQLPQNYGIEDRNMPESFGMQVIYPIVS